MGDLLFYSFYLQVIPLAFAFVIHSIASRYYMLETKYAKQIQFDIDLAKQLIIDGNHFEKFLPPFMTGVQQVREGVYDFRASDYGLDFGLLGGRGGVTQSRTDVLFLNNGKSYMVGFLTFSWVFGF